MTNSGKNFVTSFKIGLMTITEIEIVPMKVNSLRAFVNITVDDFLRIRGFKIIYNDDREYFYLAVPSVRKNDENQNIVYPISKEKRQELEKFVLDKYEEYLTSMNSIVSPGYKDKE